MIEVGNRPPTIASGLEGRVAEAGSIPILATFRNRGVCLGVRLRRRRHAEGAMSDRLVTICRDPETVVSIFASLRFDAEATGKASPEVLDLDSSSERFCRRCGVSLLGDSLSLSILLGLRLHRAGIQWPTGIYATGAVRHSRGYRCAAVAGARVKIRLLDEIGYHRFFLPQKNHRDLRLAGFDLRRTTALPTKILTCLYIWDAFIREFA